jgi:hypothetical protein
MSSKPTKAKEPAPPLNVWGPAVALAWFVPGGGHFLLKRYGRAGLLLAAVLVMFLFGLMMRGELSRPAGDDLLFIVAILVWCLFLAGSRFVRKRYGRAGQSLTAILVLADVLVTLLFCLTIRGVVLSQRGDLLAILMYYGSLLCNVLTGVPYMIAVWFGYAQKDVAGAVHDYGTKFLVTAGLLNVLAMVDAYEIAIGKKS